MIGLRKAAVVGSVIASLAVAPAALASGGVNSGGVNSGGVNSGGGSGGGGGGGTTTPPPCISTFSNTTGYYSIWAAIWTNFGITQSSCPTASTWTMTYTNESTGQVDFQRGTTVAAMPSGVVDEDWASFSTTYDVTLTVSDAAGNVVASKSAPVTTKAPKQPGA